MSQRVYRWMYKIISFTVFISMLTGLVPPPAVRARSTDSFSASNASGEVSSATLVPPSAVPPVDKQLPALMLRAQVSPARVAVGDLITVTLIVGNQSATAAHDVQVTLPVPKGTVALAGPSQLRMWSLPQLASHTETTLMAQFRLMQVPLGRAVLVESAVIAQELTVPVRATSGAVVGDTSADHAITLFTPGADAVLHSSDGQLVVLFPAGAQSTALTLQYRQQAPPGTTPPPTIAGFHQGFGTFYLTATDQSGQVVHQFAQPLSITIHYTLEQLKALSLDETDLTLFWFDTTTGRWMPLATDVDLQQHTVTTQVNHFTAFQLSDGSQPSAAYIPSLQGWQVGLYTGDVSYSYPIEVPAGPAGIKPQIQLSYNSAATDGKTGLRALQQASWVGKGWSLDTGFVGLNKVGPNGIDSRYYSLVFNGQSFNLVRGNPLGANHRLTHPEDWEWHPTDESFIRASVTLASGHYQWQVWTKDGTRYDFQDDAWQAWVDPSDCANPDLNYSETYKWYLTRITDTHNNEINYSYARDSHTLSTCFTATVDWDVWPTSIQWGGTRLDPTYKVDFTSSARSLYGIDVDGDGATNHIGGVPPHEERRLDMINVYSNPGSGWTLVRRYDLAFADATNSLVSDRSKWDGVQYVPEGTKKLTLQSITRRGASGTALPAVTFTYGTSRGSSQYPLGSWNRLTNVNNGQGGQVSFTYETIGAVIPANGDKFVNNRRVLSKTVTDGRGHSYPWSYDYTSGTPAYNTMGTLVGGSTHGPNAYPTSATLYFNQKWDPLHDWSPFLLHGEYTEFLGHSYVVETDPNNNRTEHWFYQGDVGCYPQDVYGNPLIGEAITTNACFVQLRDQEFRKGREWKTLTHAGLVSGPKLSETQHTFGVTFLSDARDIYADDRVTGLWRAFTVESQTTEKAWDNGSTALTKTNSYTYDVNNYGNLTLEVESDANGILRQTSHSYATYTPPDRSAYLVDRKRSDNIMDGLNQWLARTIYFYDNYMSGGLDATGNLTLVRKYYNLTVPPSPNFAYPGYSQDTRYGYDTYGNQTTKVTPFVNTAKGQFVK